MSTDNQQDDRLQQRIAGRKAARDVIDLAIDYGPEVFRSSGSDGLEAYWNEIRDQALKFVPLPEPAARLVKATPMTDAEARKFEKEQIPFGMYQGLRVGSADPDYLRRTADYTFIDDLRRYLANETIARSS